MTSTWDSFERYKQRGLDARRAGQWDSARTYLLEAARCMVELSKAAQGNELITARRDTATKLLELARDCEQAKAQNRKPGQATRTKAAAANNDQKEDGEPSFLVKEKPTTRFSDIAGLDDVKQDIKLKMLYPFEHPELAERYGIKAGGGVLLYGPPGTGKTMLAKATAGELEAAFFKVTPAELLSKWVGEAEQNVAKLFEAAAKEPRSIIFIDEIEALVPARQDEGTSVMQRVVPQILQGMEGFDARKNAVMFMGATNVPWQLDPAVLRPGRFDEKVYIPPPDLAARKKLLEIHLLKRPLAQGVDLDAWAARLEGYSGADIKYIADQAAVVPFMRAIACGDEAGLIDDAVLEDVLASTPRSITSEMLREFEAWAKARGG